MSAAFKKFSSLHESMMSRLHLDAERNPMDSQDISDGAIDDASSTKAHVVDSSGTEQSVSSKRMTEIEAFGSFEEDDNSMIADVISMVSSSTFLEKSSLNDSQPEEEMELDMGSSKLSLDPSLVDSATLVDVCNTTPISKVEHDEAATTTPTDQEDTLPGGNVKEAGIIIINENLSRSHLSEISAEEIFMKIGAGLVTCANNNEETNRVPCQDKVGENQNDEKPVTTERIKNNEGGSNKTYAIRFCVVALVSFICVLGFKQMTSYNELMLNEATEEPGQIVLSTVKHNDSQPTYYPETRTFSEESFKSMLDEADPEEKYMTNIVWIVWELACWIYSWSSPLLHSSFQTAKELHNFASGESSRQTTFSSLIEVNVICLGLMLLYSGSRHLQKKKSPVPTKVPSAASSPSKKRSPRKTRYQDEKMEMLTNDELKDRLKEIGFPVTAKNKKELVLRLSFANKTVLELKDLIRATNENLLQDKKIKVSGIKTELVKRLEAATILEEYMK
eukprot:scaffold99849_cov61-Attheya_sp.AAC.2